MGKFRFLWGSETLKNCLFTCFWFVVMRLFYFIINHPRLPLGLSVCSVLYTFFNTIFSFNRFFFPHLLGMIQKCDWADFQTKRVFSQIYRTCLFINVFHTLDIGYCYLNEKEGKTDLYLSHLIYKYLGLWMYLDAFPKNFCKTNGLSIC